LGASAFAQGGHISLWRAGVLLEQAQLGPSAGVGSGRTYSFDSLGLDLPTAHRLNDRAAAFCDSSPTPGAPNPACGTIACFDGNVRAVEPPGVGELLVTEVFANPVGNDRNGEWLEVLANVPRDVNGLTIVNDTGASHQSITIRDPLCRRVGPSHPGVIAFLHREDRDAVVSPLAPDAFAWVGSDSFLFSSPLTLTLSWSDDTVDVAAVPAAAEGASQALAAAAWGPGANEDPAAFCTSSQTGYFDGYGSPGATNLCGSECVDAGDPRSAIPPAGLEVVEIYADPPGADARRDYAELRLSGAGDFNGVWLHSASATGAVRKWQVLETECIWRAAGTLVVVGGDSAELVLSGGDSAMFYSAGQLALYSAGGGLLAESVPYSAVSGQAYSADGTGRWCQAAPTPGTENGACP
jgi:hypothetical protein